MRTLLDIVAQLEPSLAWCAVLSTALFSCALDLQARRLFHPVTVALWAFGIATAAWIGGWGMPQINTAVVFLAATHASLMIGTRARAASDRAAPEAAASTEVSADTTATPSLTLRLSDAQADSAPLRKSA